MYTTGYSNLGRSPLRHSPYSVPPFNYTYFNSPPFAFTNTKLNGIQNHSFIEEDTKNYNKKNVQTNNDKSFNDKSCSNNEDSTSKGFDFSRYFKFSENSISIFGFSITIDDLVIIGLLIFLLYEKCDDIYLIILLGLLFFDIKLDFWR